MSAASVFGKMASIEILDGLSERRCCRLVEKLPCDVFLDRFESPPTAEGNHGGAAGHGFEWHEAEVFVAGADGRDGSSVEIREILFRDVAEECNGWAGQAFQTFPIRAASCDREGESKMIIRFDCDVDAFVGGEGGDDEKIGSRT